MVASVSVLWICFLPLELFGTLATWMWRHYRRAASQEEGEIALEGQDEIRVPLTSEKNAGQRASDCSELGVVGEQAV
ncbi:hypothetical protein CALCODRAFT_503539 [Calocera cornea HHB12733]|uniref:Uncharacterized protein n=1 Tax=Calocera cornea HHB12733 TaxID=1353952 RepID=A0A165CUH6_9BASI|nr:hypothetical protein CALCODRAFT_503539 [Calocera cornea HHB12733]